MSAIHGDERMPSSLSDELQASDPWDEATSVGATNSADHLEGEHDDAGNHQEPAHRLDLSSLKVHGREHHLQRLHASYRFVAKRGLGQKLKRGEGELSIAIVLEGLSGTGKSTLVKQFMEQVVERTALPESNLPLPYFIQGKYEELSGADPFSAIVAAFSNFITSLLDGDPVELEFVREAVNVHLGPEAATLTTLIPDLKAVLKDDNSPIASKANSLNKLRYNFQVFVNAICSKRRPVVMFLDDLHWCDAASVELIHAVLTDLDLRHFMFIGSYRSDQVKMNVELVHCFQIVEKYQTLEKLHLSNLLLQDLNDLVQDALGWDNGDNTMHLAEFLYGRAEGNIFNTIQVLQELLRKGFLAYSPRKGQWDWKATDIDLNELLAEDVASVVADRIVNLSTDLQQLLTLAAYTRSSFDAKTLALLSDLDCDSAHTQNIHKILDSAVFEGLLTNHVGSEVFSFAHDRVQEAAYSLIPPGPARDDFRSRLGLRLYEIALKAGNASDWMFFVSADHLNANRSSDKAMDPILLVNLNLRVANRAASISAFETASKYLCKATDILLQFEEPWKNHYETTVEAYRSSAEIKLSMGNFEEGQAVAKFLLDHGQSFDDKLPTLVAVCKALGRAEHHRESFNMTLRVLRQLSAVPRTLAGMRLRLMKNRICIRRYFRSHPDDEILSKPLMANERLEVTMELLSVLAFQAYCCGALIDYLCAIQQMILISLKHGYCTYSGVALMGYSLFYNACNDMDGAYRFAHLAGEVISKTGAREIECLHVLSFAHFILAWRDPHEKVLRLYNTGHKIGMEMGDFENALLNMTAACHHEFAAGYSLPSVESKFKKLLEKLKVYSLESIMVMSVGQFLPVQHLRGSAGLPSMQELKEFGPTRNDSAEGYRLLFGYLGRLVVAVFFNEDEFALCMAQSLATMPWMDTGCCPISLMRFFSALALSTGFRTTRKRKWLSMAKKNIKELESLGKIKGANSWHRCLIMKAHFQAAKGGDRAVIQASYDDAISAASRGGNDHDAALCSQLAAEYFLTCIEAGDRSMTTHSLVTEYFRYARDKYLAWGAIGLVNHLERLHPNFLSPTPPRNWGNPDLATIWSSMVSSQEDPSELFCVPKTIITDDNFRSKEDVSVVTLHKC